MLTPRPIIYQSQTCRTTALEAPSQIGAEVWVLAQIGKTGVAFIDVYEMAGNDYKLVSNQRVQTSAKTAYCPHMASDNV